MSHFVPCPACNRHVLSAEIACPFCTAAMPESLRLQTPAPRQPGRLSRAALLAAGAALMGAEACGSPVVPAYGGPPPDAAVDSSTMDGSAVALYGAAPAPAEQAAPAGAAPGAPRKS